MATKQAHIHQSDIAACLDFGREVLKEMDMDKLELVLDALISITILAVSITYGSNLDIAIVAVTVIQGVKFPRLMKAYYEVKTKRMQATFGED
jgi:hypothetical protein